MGQLLCAFTSYVPHPASRVPRPTSHAFTSHASRVSGWHSVYLGYFRGRDKKPISNQRHLAGQYQINPSLQYAVYTVV